VTDGALSKDRIVGALAEVWSSLRELLAGVPPAAWREPTDVPGWDVQAHVAHVIGTEQMLLGEPAPVLVIDRASTPHVRNDIGAFNEVWVQALSSRSPSEVLELFDRVTARRLDALEHLGDEAWNAESATPAGRDTYGRFMRIRVFDCWFHEQDIRVALDRPGHERGLAVDVTLDEVAAALGFVVGRRAGVPAGHAVRFALVDRDGAAYRRFDVDVGDRARVVDELDREPSVTLTMPLLTFTRLCGGRIRADQATAVTVTGDSELGTQVLANLAYTI
jgi:uncharacterized protein (TIGR03083 family)